MDAPIDLSTYDQDTIARWWNELNYWRWPDDFPIPKPEGWDGMSDGQKFNNLVFYDAFKSLLVLMADHFVQNLRDPRPVEKTWRDKPPML